MTTKINKEIDSEDIVRVNNWLEVYDEIKSIEYSTRSVTDVRKYIKECEKDFQEGVFSRDRLDAF